MLVGVGGTSSNAYSDLVLKKLAKVLRPLLVAILMGIYGFTSSISITEGSSLLNGVALISAEKDSKVGKKKSRVTPERTQRDQGDPQVMPK